ncbi:SGNH/GDSL hydrolase family protein [Tropicimonas sp. IMCC34011]|uniref:SGNH/GDSL hydrolase family protein n=1 Tax=Tropicimonas sp. IMCC34011 TaxID=2248759 RepID=UPI0018E58ECC|nr:SGNH/GDSL hydrolase family protein [Tropicimonas sp. IMCC34011]
MNYFGVMRAVALGCGLTAATTTGGMAQADEDQKNILVFGDSITWGWVPKDPIVPTERHAEEDRWPEIMAEALGDGYHIVTEGLSGRTTNVEDPDLPGLMNGAEYLDSAILSHEPLDLVIIMLGTNDTKSHLHRTPLEIGLGMGELVNIVQEDAGPEWYTYDVPQVLVISPPLLGDEIDPGAAEQFRNGSDKIGQLPPIYSAIAEAAGEHFFDAASVVGKSDVGPDGIHLLVSGNEALGTAVAENVREILE